MSRKLLFGKTAFLVLVIVGISLCASVSFGRGRGGGGGGGGGGGRGGSFGYAPAARSMSGGQFDRAGFASANRSDFAAGTRNWSGNVGNHANWNYGNYYHGYGGWGNGWGWGWGGWGLGWGLGGYWPWYAGWGWNGGYPYDNYYNLYPDDGSYYYSYAPTSYGDAAVADNGPTAPPQAPPTSPEASTTPPSPATSMDAQDQQAASEGLQYYSQGRDAFLQGEYRTALRMGGHAAVDAPQNPKVHELISLALFALGNYPAAAGEAHAAMALGPIAEWKDLYGYYNNADKYTAQLRALEKAAADKPKSAAEHFLLGYHYVMTGARDNAKAEFSEAVKLTPKDKLANHYLQQLESNSPLTPPQMAAKPGSESR